MTVTVCLSALVTTDFKLASYSVERLYEETALCDLSIYKVSRLIFSNLNTVEFRTVFN